VIAFTIRRAPPSWSNRRGHWSTEYKAKRDWRELAWFGAASARVLCSDLSMRLVPDARAAPEKRAVTIIVHRCQLLDHDNLVASVKPILDGLKGQIIVDDSPRWLELSVRQVKAPRRALERTEIEVTRCAGSQVDSRATQQQSAV